MATTAVGCSALLGVTACTTGAPTGAGDEDLLSFDWGVPAASYLALYVAQDQGYFQDEGLDPSFQSFTTGAPLLAALESDSLDIATTGLATVFALGKGIDIRFITFEGDAAAVEGLVAREGGAVATLEDIAGGAPVAVPTGTCAQVSAYYAMESLGKDYSDLNAVDIAPNLYANALTSESIDAGFSWSPYLVELERNGHNIIGWDEEWVPGGGSCPETHIGRSAFLEEHPEVGSKIVRAVKRAWQDIRDDESVAVAALASRLSISEEIASEVVARYVAAQPTSEQLTDPTNRYSMVGTEGLVKQLGLASDAFAALGVIEEQLTIEELDAAVDEQYVLEVQGARQ
ncbi:MULTISPECIES: ABC transporter substrate-binding protein [unclassified Arthrobacter]|uniref:ABC transporter substrate-binding protein n=1 Tax=unclassified Arthrobacter TaxID=235627 RepID=UPI0015E285C2|nr:MULTISPECIES: ABC transporter substrate-binding protein [unclassified Arthrobacter]